MPYTWKDTARLIGGTKVAKRVTKQKNTTDDMESGNRNTPVTTPPAKTSGNDIIDMDYLSPGLQGMAPQNEQEIEIEDELLHNDATKKVPLKIDPIGKTLGTVRNLDGMRTKAVNIGDRYYEFHTGDMYNSRRETEKNRQGKDETKFYVDGDDVNSLGLPSLSGDSKIDLMLYTALAERGEGEAGGSDNDTKYAEWYYNKRVKDYQNGEDITYPWCATFVSWAADQAGIGSSIYDTIDGVVPKYEGCRTGQNLYKSKGRLHKVDDKNDNYKPKAGDTFFMSTPGWEEGTGHTGLVLAYDEKNDIVYTIEGNADDKVKVGKKHRTSLHSFGSNGGTKYGIIPKSYDETYGGVL